MERLTRKVDGKTVFPSELVGVTLTPDNVVLYKLLMRLAAYEDTGLEPEEVKRSQLEIEAVCVKAIARTYGVDINRLRKLAEADKDGRVVVLPGITVFEVTWDAGPDCDLVCPVSIDGHGCCDFCDKGELCIYESKCRQENIEQIGKTVFRTREEAEKVLKTMEGE